MMLTALETTGSPTDGLAITRFSKEHPSAQIEIYATTLETAAYFEVMYRATAKWIEDYKLNLLIHFSDQSQQKRQSRIIYTGLKLATIFASQTRFTFNVWFTFLNFLYSKRLKGFTRTVQ